MFCLRPVTSFSVVKFAYIRDFRLESKEEVKLCIEEVKFINENSYVVESCDGRNVKITFGKYDRDGYLYHNRDFDTG